jgi:hypothetical protein
VPFEAFRADLFRFHMASSKANPFVVLSADLAVASN